MAEPEIEVEIKDQPVVLEGTNVDKPLTTPEAPEIEVVDDTPPADQGRPRRPEGVEADIPDDDELKTYSAGVQARIKKLRWEFHEERRAKEERERQLNAAIDWAKKVSHDNKRLSETLSGGEQLLKEQAVARVAAEKASAKDQYQKASEAGDPAAMAAAVERLSKLASEERDIENYQPRPFQPAPPPVINQAPVHDPKLLKWVSDNPWFQRDRHMTNYAMALDARLQEKEGILPTSDLYYKRIDEAMRKEFPEQFRDYRADDAQPRERRPSIVAPAARPTGTGPTRVTLTSSQVQVAKKLGITPEQYARQVLKEKTRG